MAHGTNSRLFSVEEVISLLDEDDDCDIDSSDSDSEMNGPPVGYLVNLDGEMLPQDVESESEDETQSCDNDKDDNNQNLEIQCQSASSQ